jgi:hypothetical protein
VVVEDHLLAGLKLIDARPEVLGGRTLRDPDGADSVGRCLERIVQVAHTKSVRGGTPGADLPGRGARRGNVKHGCVAVLLAIAVSGCFGGSARQHDSAAERAGTQLKAPLAMIATPKWALAACGSVTELRRFCPGQVPLTSQRGWTMTFTAPRRRFPLALFQLQSGVAWGGFQERVHRPPILGNTVVLGGQFMRLNARAFPSSGARPVVVRNGMANGLRRRPIALGPRTWSGIQGELSLTPTSYYDLGELSDLVVFRWRDAAGSRAVGVNVWEPLTDSVATLRAIVSMLAPQPGGRQPRMVAVVDGVPMTTTPLWLSDLCRTPPMLRFACPSRVPAVGLQGAYVDVVPTPPSERPKLRSLLVSVGWGGEYPDPRQNRPPNFMHLELTAGHVVSSKHFAPPVPLSRLTLPKSYVVTRPISLGQRDWTLLPGRLVFGDCFGNHLCYRWRENGRGYQVDLHAWEPVTQTAHVLRAIVASTPSGGR